LRCRGLAIRLADLRIRPTLAIGLVYAFPQRYLGVRVYRRTGVRQQLDELRAWAARPDLDATAEYISTRVGVEGQAPGSGRRGLADARLGRFDELAGLCDGPRFRVCPFEDPLVRHPGTRPLRRPACASAVSYG